MIIHHCAVPKWRPFSQSGSKGDGGSLFNNARVKLFLLKVCVAPKSPKADEVVEGSGLIIAVV